LLRAAATRAVIPFPGPGAKLVRPEVAEQQVAVEQLVSAESELAVQAVPLQTGDAK
jgi:hypothetical protein